MLGEETVLLKALEGKRGQPEQRPPHPAERGLFGRPTVVQNVQTLAAVPWIVRNGAAAFAAIGTPDAPGHDPRPASGAGRRRHRRGARWGRRCATIVGLRRQAAGRSDRSRRSSSAARRAASCRPTCSTRRTRSTALRAARRPRRLGLDRRRPTTAACVVDLAAPADPLLRRRGVRQDDPLPDRHAPARGDRRPGRSTGRPRPTDLTCSTDLSADIVDCAPVRPRAPGDPPADQRDAILPVRARRAHPAKRLPAGVCHPIAVAAGATA